MALKTGDKALAAAHATWEPVPKAETAEVPAPVLKQMPQLTSEAAQSAAVDAAFERAVTHMHDAEDGKAEGVVGMKTYGLAIMHEVFDMDAETIVKDAGALSDLTEYLLAMVYAEQRVYVRGGDIAAEHQDNPDVQLAQSLVNTWELPDNEFGAPAMYQRVQWQ